MAKEHAIEAAQHDLPLMGVRGEVIDVELRRVGRVLVRLRDGGSVTVDRWRLRSVTVAPQTSRRNTESYGPCSMLMRAWRQTKMLVGFNYHFSKPSSPQAII